MYGLLAMASNTVGQDIVLQKLLIHVQQTFVYYEYTTYWNAYHIRNYKKHSLIWKFVK